MGTPLYCYSIAIRTLIRPCDCTVEDDRDEVLPVKLARNLVIELKLIVSTGFNYSHELSRLIILSSVCNPRSIKSSVLVCVLDCSEHTTVMAII